MAQANGMENIMQKTCFSNVSMVMLFSCHILGERFLNRNLATILPLKSKLSLIFQSFNTFDGSTKMLQNSCIFRISINVKKFKTFYELKTVSHLKKIIQSSPTK